ncbi:MAG: hypothetical protein ACOYM0_15010 [Bacteroidales bacterium]
MKIKCNHFIRIAAFAISLALILTVAISCKKQTDDTPTPTPPSPYPPPPTNLFHSGFYKMMTVSANIRKSNIIVSEGASCARAVVDFLKDNGIGISRLEFKGFGPDPLIAPNTEAEGNPRQLVSFFTLRQENLGKINFQITIEDIYRYFIIIGIEAFKLEFPVFI